MTLRHAGTGKEWVLEWDLIWKRPPLPPKNVTPDGGEELTTILLIRTEMSLRVRAARDDV